jgi:hypothetical protein
MQLPRFTSGEVGRLTFAHLNEAFSALENLEREAEMNRRAQQSRDRVLTARVTGSQGQLYSWVEVHRDGGVYVTKPDGQTSGDSSNPFAFPIVGTISGGANPNAAYGIVPQYDDDGNLFYVVGFAAGCCCNP